MSLIFNLVGQQFGRLLVTGRAPNSKANLKWFCECLCGKSIVVFGGNLTKGTTKSCGCFRKEKTAIEKTKHRMCQTSEYHCWASMKQRCFDENHASYQNYGGRGITVCKRWVDSFEAFFEDMGPKPGKGYSIERMENSKGYSKANCKWATYSEQNKNRRKWKKGVVC